MLDKRENDPVIVAARARPQPSSAACFKFLCNHFTSFLVCNVGNGLSFLKKSRNALKIVCGADRRKYIIF
jgi:hypothetical protein